MYRLLIFTADGLQGGPDQTVEVRRPDGAADTYVFVARVGHLAYYRRENVPEAEALTLIGYAHLNTESD